MIPAIVIVTLLDKPDYDFFNFIHRNIVPIAEVVGRGLTYPARVVGRFADNMRKRRDILGENIEITARLETLEKTIMEKELLEKENALLMEKLNMAKAIKYRTAASRIIHDNSFMENQNFILERPGDEVSPGNIVVSNTGFLLGVVVENTGGYSKIRSVRDSRSNIPVRISGTNVFGFLQGGGNSSPELKFLSDGDFSPAPEMPLVTSGVNGNVPNDIPVGRIESADDGRIRVKLGAELKNQESVILLFFNKNERYD